MRKVDREFEAAVPGLFRRRETLASDLLDYDRL